MISPETKKIIDNLNEKEKARFKALFGIDFENCKNEGELHKQLLNISKERIAEVEEKALKKLGGSGVYDN